MNGRIDVLGIGNAMVDILSFAKDADLRRMQLEKGIMVLIDSDDVRRFEAAVKPVSRRSGGSIANSMACVSALGGKAGYIGKIADDETGEQFSRDMRAAGIEFSTLPIGNKTPTGRCYIFVTDDAQRTMCTFLGACTLLSPDDLDVDAIERSSVILIEGYLWDSPSARELVMQSSKQASKSETKVALSLSDPMLVDRHRESLQSFVEQDVDILFANEQEAGQLYKSMDLRETLATLQEQVSTLVVTRSEHGSVVVQGGEEITRAPDPVSEVVDTTGAGDAYAGGFLRGFVRDMPIRECMDIASAAAAEVIEHIGGRPDQTLSSRTT